MQKHLDITRRRVQAFASAANLRGKVYPQRTPVSLSVYAAPDRCSFAEALRGDYRPTQVGEHFGPVWSTHWFKVDISIPREWHGHEVHLLWDSSSEACVWQDGQPLQGLTGMTRSGNVLRPQFALTKHADGGEALTLYVEVACNELFGLEGHTPPVLIGLLRQAEIAVFDRAAWDLLWDFVIVADMAQHLPPDTPRAGQALYAANQMVNTIDLDDARTWAQARAIAQAFLAARNGDGHHNLSAIGHAHIDTAWLWSLAETRRKCYRTFATALRYMDDYPDYLFVCSQAQQLAWMKESQSALYERIKARVREGRFVPAGGTWVEPDCNIPSGESLVRQFLHGQRFFQQEFGIRCTEFWNPDVFGYSGALPQIIRGAGLEYFLTQKLSWNQFNKPTSHTFIWEGIDGSRVLTHFPPADTYNADASVKEVLFNVRNFKDHERANESYYLFGHGDGGGGPTLGMLERLQRMRDVDGLPRVQMRSPREFFARCAADVKQPTVWTGELYFELHRGTYTSQARTKRDNRRSEWLLHDVEFLSAVTFAPTPALPRSPSTRTGEGAVVPLSRETGEGSGVGAYPAAELDRLWKLVLLNQFHDIIPGSSIREVYADSAAHYADILASGARLREQAIDALVETWHDRSLQQDSIVAINTLSAARTEVVELPLGMPTAQQSADGKSLGVVNAPPMGFAVIDRAGLGDLRDLQPVGVSEAEDTITLENAFVRAVFRRDGRLMSLFDKRAGREAIEPGAAANNFVLFDDEPLAWSAWDVDVFHLEKRYAVGAATSVRVVERGPLRAAVVAEYDLRKGDPAWSPSAYADDHSGSSLRQTISLTAVSARVDFACEVDWHERHKFLKVEFPLNVRANDATYEIQFGHVQRPTHFNTTWDLARFEVCAHRWADLSEPDFGVALLNDSKYGYATHRNVMRLSLLRAPTSPDAEADQGQHTFRYALLPHLGSFREGSVIEEGYRLNVPLLLRATRAAPQAVSLLSVDRAGVVIETVKKTEDSDALIVRLYEAHGTRGRVRLTSVLPIRHVRRCNLLEDDEGELAWTDGGVAFDVTPFQIVTLKLVV